MRGLISLTIFAISALIAVADEKCGPNQSYNWCGPSCVGDGCDDWYYPGCINECKEGCFCDCGYYRNERGECVPGEKCPRGYPTNSNYSANCPCNQCDGEYEYYVTNLVCEDWCEKDEKLRNCNEIETRCFCLPGYKRDPRTGYCIPEKECPTYPNTTCPADETYVTCGPACESADACDGDVRPECYEKCVPRCVCNCGYYRDESGRCVPSKECPRGFPTNPYWSQHCPCGKCGENEYFTTAYMCQDVCNQRGCYRAVQTRCFCLPGYYRDPKSGRCILTEEWCQKILAEQG